MKGYVLILFSIFCSGKMVFSQTKDSVKIPCRLGLDSLEHCKVYAMPEVMAEFPGGMTEFNKYIASNLKFSAEEADGFRGTIYISFIIDTEGKVRNTCIYRGIGSSAIDKEALRVINAMPAWKTGWQAGEKVCTQFAIPIKILTR